jgi:mercuric ion transport protein
MAAPQRAAFEAATSRQAADQTPRLLAIGGVLCALGAASCCVIPIALFLAGISGAWIGNLTALEPYQPIFLALSLGSIGLGAWRIYRKPKVACADGYCATPRSDRIAKIGVWTAAVIVILAIAFRYGGQYLL